MKIETSGFPAGELRASDADRDLAVAELSEHFQTGRLTQEEFDDRSGRALQARTGRELSELFTDLPAGQAGPSAPLAARFDRSPRCYRPVALVIGVVAAIALVSAIGGVGLGQVGFGWLIPLVIVALIVRRAARRR